MGTETEEGVPPSVGLALKKTSNKNIIDTTDNRCLLIFSLPPPAAVGSTQFQAAHIFLAGTEHGGGSNRIFADGS